MQEEPKHNPYAAPQSACLDPMLEGTLSNHPPFFPVGKMKLCLMSFCTLGIYELFWFYKNWQQIRLHTGEKILPFGRAFFAVLFCYPFFKRVCEAAERAQLASANYPAGLLAAGWMLLTLCGRLPDPFWLISFLAVFVLLPVQTVINEINDSAVTQYEKNEMIEGWNWLALFIGAGFWLMILVGFMPE